MRHLSLEAPDVPRGAALWHPSPVAAAVFVPPILLRTHVRLPLALESAEARACDETEAARQGRLVRQLERRRIAAPRPAAEKERTGAMRKAGAGREAAG